MLNGVAPILVFTFKTNLSAASPLFSALEGLPMIGTDVASVLSGAPIPIYLDEKITGIYVENEDRHIDIATTNEQTFDDGDGLNYQRNLNSSVSVNLLANKESMMLPALLALMDQIIPKLVSQNYTLSYFNGPILILNGLLQGFNTISSSDDTLVRIQLQIQKQHKGTSRPSSIIAGQTGPTP